MNLYGSSSGGVLAMFAAGAGLPVAKLAMWEPPFIRLRRADHGDVDVKVLAPVLEAFFAD